MKPVPITFVDHCVNIAQHTNGDFVVAVANMASTGFFYLNCPGEHTYSSEKGFSTPFQLQAVGFYYGAHHLSPS